MSDRYALRREKIFRLMPEDTIIILSANTKKTRNGDAEYAFRQESYFYYVSGFEEDDAVLVLLKTHKKNKFIVFCKETTELEARWQGARLGPKGAVSNLGANEAYEYAPLSELKKAYPEIFLKIEIEANSILSELRLIKTQEEIDLLRKAAQISAGAHIRAMKACKAGMFEYELEAEYLYEFRRHGARSPAYTSIVGTGENACVLHYTDNDSILKEGELVLVDAGAEYQYYAADITRGFPVNGRFSEPQKAIYELVLKAQLAAIEKVQVGISWDTMQTVIVKILVEGLVSLGILHGDVDALIKNQAYKKYYMHNSGHWLGLDVHDVGAYKVKEAWRLLEVGMVLTVEPGLYFSPDCHEIEEKWRGIGVRIEDDVLVTSNGPDVLSKDTPKTIQAIEALMHSN